MATSLTPWNKCLLSAYYYATLPRRRRSMSRHATRQQAPVMILFYHRVADHTLSDWTITNQQFERHVDWLQRRFDLIGLAEAQTRIAEGNSKPAVSITFDDGYAENCDRALPLLIQRGIPCTYFVASHFVLSGAPFPHDAAAGKPLPPNSLEQLRSLAAAGVELGGHTRTHADLGRVHDPRRLWSEVVESRDELADAVGCEIRYFAFPYGQPRNLNTIACRMAETAGFHGVCSAYGGYNFPGDQPFHLQRIHGDPEFVRLKNWLMLDPRKVETDRETLASREITLELKTTEYQTAHT